ncbi:hypothetical protein chiPu_0030178, partial [Chiloscyllium punctatum]|nr:hypothetical protein [Chiloscyllium punctatum]
LHVRSVVQPPPVQLKNQLLGGRGRGTGVPHPECPQEVPDSLSLVHVEPRRLASSVGRPVDSFEGAPAVKRQLGSIPATQSFLGKLPEFREEDEGEIGGGHLGLEKVAADRFRVVPGVRHRPRTLLREVTLCHQPLPH